MNAYELAEIMEIHDGSLIWEHGLEIANMLRQQADRIAELEKENTDLNEERIYWRKQCEKLYTTPQTKPLSDLDPLFYYNKGFNDALRKMIDTKPLSDEEIWKLWHQHLDDEITVFARAIEERILGK